LSGSDETGAGGGSANTITPAQSRAARGLLNWSSGELARRVGVDEGFVDGFEAGSGDPASGQIEALRSALMQAGIVFGEDADSGVRLSGQGRGEGTRLDALTTENDR